MQFVLNKIFIIGLGSLLSSASLASTPAYPYPFCDPKVVQATQAQLAQIYTATLPATLPERLRYFSQLFLDKPYALTALGEGLAGQFDQAPLYRFDAFDCQTYVETVLALALSGTAAQFKACIRKIRYTNGEKSYLHRHHFTSPDWNRSNQQQGLLEDITLKILDQSQNTPARMAETLIHEANWYQHFAADKIRLCAASPLEVQHSLEQLKKLGKFLPAKSSTIAYLPIEVLIGNDKNSQFILDQIPNRAIIEIIRPDWDLTKTIGTHLNVSHMGVAIREQGNIFLYQASSVTNKVSKTLLTEYLRSMQSHPTIKGINVQSIVASDRCRT